MWGYISRGCFNLRINENEVGSSTMPHKVNPIDFENSEGNVGIAVSLFQHLSTKLLVSRYQRDLSDSTALRNIGVGFAHMLVAVTSAHRGLCKIIPNQQQLLQELQGNWELLGEPIQTVMRKHGAIDSYEQLKEFTRGQQVDEHTIRTFITKLQIPEYDKQVLLQLRPETYVGLAPQLALDAVQQVQRNRVVEHHDELV
uniref:Adenylosuccinate lyase n=1 Tax=Lygus hesperus TaxID=30085 RepID=A0A0A9Z3G7_LYGHE